MRAKVLVCHPNLRPTTELVDLTSVAELEGLLGEDLLGIRLGRFDLLFSKTEDTYLIASRDPAGLHDPDLAALMALF